MASRWARVGRGTLFCGAAACAGVLVAGQARADILAQYDFDRDLAEPALTAPGVLAEDFTSHSPPVTFATGSSGGDRALADAGWSSGSNYFEVWLTAAPGKLLRLTRVAFDARHSDSGPPEWSMRLVRGTTVTPVAAGVDPSNAWISHDIDVHVLGAGARADFGLRLHGTGATSTGGQWRLDNVVIEGSVIDDLDAGASGGAGGAGGAGAASGGAGGSAAGASGTGGSAGSATDAGPLDAADDAALDAADGALASGGSSGGTVTGGSGGGQVGGSGGGQVGGSGGGQVGGSGGGQVGGSGGGQVGGSGGALHDGAPFGGSRAFGGAAGEAGSGTSANGGSAGVDGGAGASADAHHAPPEAPSCALSVDATNPGAGAAWLVLGLVVVLGRRRAARGR